MNFGTEVKSNPSLRIRTGEGSVIESTFPSPAQLNLGVQGAVVTNDFFDVSATISATKPFDKTGGWHNYEAQSSFKSLFDDWDDFPNDVTAHIGLDFLWHPIHLGAGVSFFQEMYVGYLSKGPKDVYKSYYTHGIKVGLEAYGMQASAGYAGVWQNNNTDQHIYISPEFPWETFQLTLSANINTFGKQKEKTALVRFFDGIIVSGGYSYGLPIGRMKGIRIGADKVTFSKNSVWSVEADFYITGNSAIVSSFSYFRMTENIYVAPTQWWASWTWAFGIETVSFESGFRYHPFELLHPFFVQASLGVIRMNPVEPYSSPRYSYKSFDEIAIGCVAPVMEGIILIPKIALKTIFMDTIPPGRIGGYNQVELGVKVGYRL